MYMHIDNICMHIIYIYIYTAKHICIWMCVQTIAKPRMDLVNLTNLSNLPNHWIFNMPRNECLEYVFWCPALRWSPSGRFLGTLLWWCPCSADSVHCHVGVWVFLTCWPVAHIFRAWQLHSQLILRQRLPRSGVNIPTFEAQIDVAWFVWPVKSWWSLQKNYGFFRCILRLKHPYKIWDKKSMYTLIEASKKIMATLRSPGLKVKLLVGHMYNPTNLKGTVWE